MLKKLEIEERLQIIKRVIGTHQSWDQNKVQKISKQSKGNKMLIQNEQRRVNLQIIPSYTPCQRSKALTAKMKDFK